MSGLDLVGDRGEVDEGKVNEWNGWKECKSMGVQA